ncbi:RlpA-like double-psi beta-barrel domain-containing protein [Candidatus Albibeggiatoa sp. nov. BB20]|uniref:septal ring lytic transglycosylase RlpA family protein n=1 Tax=Candidatus Albibeggiatoa sp. nov. BB20 TaxID=3162723 RepID=UPI0033655BCE
MSKWIRYGACFLSLCLLQACSAVAEQPVVKTEVQAKPVIVRPTQQQPIVVKPVQATPPPDIRGFRQKTYATWYNIAEHGSPTTNGDMYDYYAMTAAHQNLPFGSQVRVRHLATGRSIIVTINDRQISPDIKLSIFAAKQLGVWGKAQPMVSIEGLSVKQVR